MNSEQYNEAFWNTVRNGKPIDDCGGFQLGDYVVKNFCQDGNAVLGGLFYRGVMIFPNGGCAYSEPVGV